ncbi:MAG: hypothetical protein IJZ20_03575, partial [Clostridia bacterium]|nr:hypothetical protein [Clostridia bacterium]
MRKNVMQFAYHLLDAHYRKNDTAEKVKTTKDNIQKYDEILSQLKAKVADKKATTEKKKATPVINIPKHMELAKIITTQTEEIEEIKTDLGVQLKKMNCETGEDVGKLQKSIPDMETVVQKYEKQEEKYKTELEKALAEFRATRDNTQGFDELEVIEERLRIRPQKEKEFSEYVYTCGKTINSKALTEAV